MRDGLARQGRAVRRGQRGEAGSRETDSGGSRASRPQAEQAVSGPPAARMTARVVPVDALCGRAGSWKQRGGEPGRMQLLFPATELPSEEQDPTLDTFLTPVLLGRLPFMMW